MDEGTVLRGRYRLERLLGRGGMAEVYLVLDLRRQVALAIKVLPEDLAEDPEFLQRFQREAEALGRLDHPNIVRFYSFEREGRAAFIVMDYVAGTTLSRRLKDAGGPLPLAEASAILHQVGSALHYAHSLGIVHRDIKPGNIMLKENGQALLSDFGIAKASGATTMTLAPIGTPSYMSPEQILGRPPTPRTDVYCLGVVLYEMVTGSKPFTGRGVAGASTAERVRQEHLHSRPADPRSLNSEVPAAAAAVILTAMAKQPDERWPDVQGLLRAWDAALAPAVAPPLARQQAQAESWPAAAAPRSGEVTLRLGKGLLFAIAGGVVVFGAGAAVLLFALLGGRHEPTPSLEEATGRAPASTATAMLTSTATERAIALASTCTSEPTATPTQAPTATRRATQTPAVTATLTRAEVEAGVIDAVERFQEAKEYSQKTWDTQHLSDVLAGQALERQVELVRQSEEQNCYWDITLDEPMTYDFLEVRDATWVNVRVHKLETRYKICNGETTTSEVRDSYETEYVVELIDSRWYVTHRE